MIGQVFLSGQIGKAVYIENDRYFSVGLDESQQPAECRIGDISLLVDSRAEFITISDKDITLDYIKRELSAATIKYRALSLVISGFNPRLSGQTRSLSIEAAEELLRDKSASAFVRVRLLSRPLPHLADIDGAISLAEAARAIFVSSVYKEVKRSQETIKTVLYTWEQVAKDFFDFDEEQATIKRDLIEEGFFAEIVTAITTDIKRLDSIVVTYGLKPKLRRGKSNYVQIMNAVKTRLLENNASVPVDNSTREIEKTHSDAFTLDQIHNLIINFENKEGWQPKSFSGDDAKNQIEKQIPAIGKLIREGNDALAARFIRDLVQFQVHHSKKEHIAKTLCRVAKIAIDAHSFDMAEELVRCAFLLGVEDAVIFSTKALLLERTGYLDDALAVHEHTIKHFYDDPYPHNGRAEVLKEMGRFDEALAAYEETKKHFPDEVVPYSGHAEVLKEMGRFDDALAAYEEAKKHFPDEVVPYNGHAEVLKEMGRFDDALAAYEEAKKHFPDEVVPYNGHAEVLKEMGRFDEALAAYEEAKKHFPDEVVPYNGHAEVLKEMGRFDDALAAYEEAKKHFPDEVVPYNGHAEVLKYMGRLDDALAAYEEAIKRFPHDAVLRNGCASVLTLMGRFTEVLSLLPQNRPISRQDWIAYHIVAMTYLKMNNIDLAIERLMYGMEKVLWLDLKNYYATALAVARMREKQFSEALDTLQNVTNFDRFQKQKRSILMAHSQAELGKSGEAISTLSAVMNAENPHIIKVRDALFRLYTLNTGTPRKRSSTESKILEQEIYEEEFVLAMAA